jgi:hypothetical protein
LPPIVTVPARGAPVNASTRNVTAPLPLPSRADAMTIHETSVAAVHRHCELEAVISTVRSPPGAPTVSSADETPNEHGLPACEI